MNIIPSEKEKVIYLWLCMDSEAAKAMCKMSNCTGPPKYKGPNSISCPPPEKKNLNLITNIKRLISIWCFSSSPILQNAPFMTLPSFYSPKNLIFIIYFSTGPLILWDGLAWIYRLISYADFSYNENGLGGICCID